MTNKQRTVIWLGLFLVALNLVIKWPTVKGIVFSGAGKAPAPAPAPAGGSNTIISPNVATAQVTPTGISVL